MPPAFAAARGLPPAADMPLFVLGVTGCGRFADARRLRAALAQLTARVGRTHRVVLHTGCGHPADRLARAFADDRRWGGGVTESSPPGFRPAEVTIRAVCGLAVTCDAVALFAADPAGPEAAFARWLGPRVRTPVRVVGG